jgi:hypothetical protein
LPGFQRGPLFEANGIFKVVYRLFEQEPGQACNNDQKGRLGELFYPGIEGPAPFEYRDRQWVGLLSTVEASPDPWDEIMIDIQAVTDPA